MGHLQKAAVWQSTNKDKKQALIIKSRSPPSSSIREILFFFRIIWASCPGNMKTWTQDSESKLNKKQNCLFSLKTHFHSVGAVISTSVQKHTRIFILFFIFFNQNSKPLPCKRYHLDPWCFKCCPRTVPRSLVLTALHHEATGQRSRIKHPNHSIPAQSGGPASRWV